MRIANHLGICQGNHLGSVRRSFATRLSDSGVHSIILPRATVAVALMIIEITASVHRDDKRSADRELETSPAGGSIEAGRLKLNGGEIIATGALRELAPFARDLAGVRSDLGFGGR